MHYRRQGTSAAAALLLLIGLVIAQKTDSRTEARQPTLVTAPDDSALRQNPYAGQRAAVLAGKKLFRRYCAECHGPEALGTTRAPGLAAGPVQSAEPGTLFWFLTNGNLKRGMPSWSGLPAQRRWQVVTYLKSLGVQVTNHEDKS